AITPAGPPGRISPPDGPATAGPPPHHRPGALFWRSDNPAQPTSGHPPRPTEEHRRNATRQTDSPPAHRNPPRHPAPRPTPPRRLLSQPTNRPSRRSRPDLDRTGSAGGAGPARPARQSATPICTVLGGQP